MQKILYFVTTLALIIPSTIFAAGASPSVESKMAKNITFNTANIYGVVSPGTAEDNGYWFEWGISGAEEVDAFKTNRIKYQTKQVKRMFKLIFVVFLLKHNIFSDYVLTIKALKLQVILYISQQRNLMIRQNLL